MGCISAREVYLYNFGEQDGSLYRGIRPVICISNIRGKQFMFCPITSRINKPRCGTHIQISKNDNKFLNIDSMIMTEHIYTRIKDGNVCGRLGKISKEQFDRVKQGLKLSIGLDGISHGSYRGNYRGDIIKYVDNHGNYQRGIIIQNNMANKFSKVVIVCPLDENNEPMYEYINTLHKSCIVDKVRKLDSLAVDKIYKEVARCWED